MKKNKFTVVKLWNRRVMMRKTRSDDVLMRFKRLSENMENVEHREIVLSPDAMDAIVRLWLERRGDFFPNGRSFGEAILDGGTDA